MTRFPACLSFLLIPALLFGETAGAVGSVQLASNQDVLQAWQTLAQSAASTPVLVHDDGGGTRIEWTGAVTLDAYRHEVSGGSQLSPFRSGSYYRANAQGDLRATDAHGTVSYLQFTGTHSNDRAVISDSFQLDMFQGGVVGEGYGLALGDVAASHSSLGTNTNLRGLYGYRQFDDTLLSVGVGVLAESWRALADSERRTRLLSNAYTAKLDTAIGERARAFVTTQAYRDDEDSLADVSQSLAPTEVVSHTAGFRYLDGALELQGEFGASRWEERGSAARNDKAWVVDAGWRGESLGLRAGHHDIGRYYASLSAEVSPGIRESYLAGDWTPREWLVLGADLRTARYDSAVHGSALQEADAVTLDATLRLAPIAEGLQLTVRHYRSDGETVDGSGQVNVSRAATLAYAAPHWSLQLSGSRDEVDSPPAGDSETTTWSGAVNLDLNRDPVTRDLWSASLGLTASRQEQDLATATNHSDNYALSINAQRVGWGTLSASYGRGWLEQSGGGDALRQENVQLDASYPMGDSRAISAYIREDANEGAQLSYYRERTYGVQFSSAW